MSLSMKSEDPNQATAKKIETAEGPSQSAEAPAADVEDFDSQVRSGIGAIAKANLIRVYDRSGKYIFAGDATQLAVFWANKDYGKIEDLGGYSLRR